MSSLKYQVKKLLDSLSLDANKNHSAVVKERYYLLKAVALSGKPVKRICESRGRSTDYFEKWAIRLIAAKSLVGLETQSQKPKHSPNRSSDQTVKWTKRLKKAHPAYGPERISFYLKLRYGCECPPSTVYAILKREKLINKKYRKQRTKAHLKRYRRPWPGWLQLDIKYVPYYVETKKIYQISAIDHHSSWRLIRVYEDHEESTVISFLNELIAVCPFDILQIQTDNASEFTDKYTSGRGARPSGSHGFDQWCNYHGIEHKLIPIGEKELNGKVENSHKYDDEEFYAFFRADTVKELELAVAEHSRTWNAERHTKTLGWKTPNETVEWAQLVALAGILAYKNLNLETLLKAVPKRETKATAFGSVTTVLKNRPKRITSLDRYLQYADWEEKKRFKAVLVWPPISQIFPK